jgi:transposase InsO family protein
MCRVLEVKEGSYFAWRKRGVSKRARTNAQLREQLLCIARETNERYGSRRATQFLRSAGVFVNRKRVSKLMRDTGIRAKSNPV